VTTTRHSLNDFDRAVMAAMRPMLAAVKGSVSGPQARAPFDALMDHVPSTVGVTYAVADVGGVSGWWCRPDGAATGAAILYLHGGAYVVGSARAYRNFVGQIASRAGLDAFIPDYRLAPDHPFPAAVEDALATYNGLARQDLTSIALAGDSAGGGLTLALLSLAAAKARVGTGLRPVGAAVISAWTDLALTGASMTTRAEADPLSTRESLGAAAKLYLNGRDPRDPMASPLYGDLAGLPPVVMHVGEDDILLDDALRYGERFEGAGGVINIHAWQGMIHVFPSNVAQLKAAPEALDQIGGFLRERALAGAGRKHSEAKEKRV
jgi:acetyl esterase/lipase